jgi:Ni,Fe-hydrogenase maturation factor
MLRVNSKIFDIMRTIYVFGNPLVREDSLPLKLIVKLRKEFPSLEFKEFDTVEDLEIEKELNIIDSVKGIKKVELIEDVDSIVTEKIYSMHDFDLGYNLKLLKKMKMIDKVRIFGIPMKINEKEAFEQLSKIIRKFEA